MELRILCKHLVADELNGKFTVGENNADTVGITLPRFYDQHDLSQFYFKITAAGKCKNAAVQMLEMDRFDEENVHLLWKVTSDFTSIPEEFTLVLTGVNSDNSVTIKFKSCPIAVNPDKSWKFMPSPELSEQLLNQVQVELKNTIKTVDKKISEYEITPATVEKLGGIKSGRDISVSDEGFVTINSVNGKTLEKSVPANAVFTDTIYTLPKATAKNLGGVKVDGKTITSSNDGTISVVDSEVIKSEIANIKSIQNSISSLAVQIAHPNNFLIYDDVGKPSVMVAVPKFYLDEVIDGASHTVHPAFIVNSVEHDVIYISKYQNIVENGRAYSLPMKNPAVNINFEQAWNYCKNKGAGWHLMTNAEWAAIALWCKKNGTMPKGNNNYGKDISESNLPQGAIAATYGSDGKINTVLTGSGSGKWYHNGNFSGIDGLNGNVWELCSGLRLVNSEIQVIENNDAADWNNSVSSDSILWKAVKPDGTLVTPGSASDTLKYDWKNDKYIISNVLKSTNLSGGSRFDMLIANDNAMIPEIAKALTLCPADKEGYGNTMFFGASSGERILRRGGFWFNRNDSSIFIIGLDYNREIFSSALGFRCCYYDT